MEKLIVFILTLAFIIFLTIKYNLLAYIHYIPPLYKDSLLKYKQKYSVKMKFILTISMIVMMLYFSDINDISFVIGVITLLIAIMMVMIQNIFEDV